MSGDRRSEHARARGFRWWVARILPALGLTLAGCAPHVVRVAELVPVVRAERYRAALAVREARGAAVDAQLLLWAEVPNTSRLPGAEGRLLLAGPDAFRLRVGSLFGTALDLGGRGDSLSAYVPSRRQGMALDARRDSLGILHPGGLAFRVLSAAWRPPDAAWSTAVWRDTLLCVSWLEEADTLEIAIGSDGLPARATLVRPGGAAVRATYRSWDRASGTPWPVLLDVDELNGGFRVTCKVSRLRFPARTESMRLGVPIPAGAERLTLTALRRALERLGSL